eukprot:CAMPEP_0114339832 /NCGR_PEP_ID=MMETSP0101-20121206/7978_1 /TAXON_ID=38822 ORGANISM="Pteridomonas danica, Strain PT" /NCGR_SAMPLE_ID=MMETSP0101 /ASSEMBLY_ACC=CAM_ASM_000211 /LENGTH=70 /DNA_ID=CAMNT_0001472903 /DNA_START=331 /DNA_END=539 /DNA_ORIENTATION=-
MKKRTGPSHEPCRTPILLGISESPPILILGFASSDDYIYKAVSSDDYIYKAVPTVSKALTRSIKSAQVST